MSFKAVAWTLLAAIAFTAVLLFNYWAAYQPLSTVAYSGIVLALCERKEPRSCPSHPRRCPTAFSKQDCRTPTSGCKDLDLLIFAAQKLGAPGQVDANRQTPNRRDGLPVDWSANLNSLPSMVSGRRSSY
jgi:hypothetical protein